MTKKQLTKCNISVQDLTFKLQYLIWLLFVLCVFVTAMKYIIHLQYKQEQYLLPYPIEINYRNKKCCLITQHHSLDSLAKRSILCLANNDKDAINQLFASQSPNLFHTQVYCIHQNAEMKYISNDQEVPLNHQITLSITYKKMNCNISRNTICFSTLLQQIYILIEIKTPRGLSIHMASFKHATSDGILNGFISSYKKCVWFFFQQSIIYLNISPATISQLVMSYFCRLSSV